ncbi:MAG: 50S ribosomal protein L11 methyltransferase [Epsilonproteobacteria bacterium]|nr:50S ribosomal protein L11 methyltransferase [Campylobacterota bacterium]
MNEFYYELTVKPENSLAIFSSFLLEVTANAIEEKAGLLIIRSSKPLEDIQWATEQLASKLQIPLETTLEQKKNEDWINNYKKSIQPLEISSFYIRPEWESAKDNLIDIIINPALAFGSGHHETTSSCIEAIDHYVQKEMHLLDVGCGSGILSIAAEKKGAIVDICDTDEVAVKSARDNFALNSATLHNAWVGSANQNDNLYDIVLANIIADVIIMIHKDLKAKVKSGGILILSGIIDKYFDKVLEKFSDFDQVQLIQKDEWHTFVLRKR